MFSKTPDPSQIRTKKCRAIGCSKLVEDREIFCLIHFPLLTPKYRAPLPDNHEPTGFDVIISKRIISGTAEAVAYIASIEGRRAALQTAVTNGAVEQTGGGSRRIEIQDKTFGTTKYLEN